MKNFYEDTKMIKIVAIIFLTLGLLGLVAISLSVIALEILKIRSLKVAALDKVISISSILFVIIVSGSILKKGDFTYFIEVKEGILKLGIKGAIYVYKINELEDCYLEKVRIHKRVIIKISGSIFEITTRKPKKLLEAIESWKQQEIVLDKEENSNNEITS